MAKVTPSTFHELLKGKKADLGRTTVKHNVYTVKILKELSKLWPLTAEDYGAIHNRNIKDPMAEIRGRIDDPVFDRIHIRYMEDVLLRHLFWRPDKHLVLKEASRFNMPGGFGLIFPVKHHRDWIAHNLGSAEGRGLGSARIVVQSRMHDLPDVWIEPLEQFIENMKGEGYGKE